MNYLYCNLKRQSILLQKKLHPGYQCKTYANRKVLSIEEGNQALLHSLQTGKPCMTTRLGYNELVLFYDAAVRKKISKQHLDKACNYAGFFPNDREIALRFGSIMEESLPLADMDALYYTPGEEYFLSKYCPGAALVANRAIEPWYSPLDPWSQCLKGKRVLVIHPFADTIRSQYERRQLLFPDTDILPEFDLSVIKAVQSIGGVSDPAFSTWFDALDYMTEQVAHQQFDVALIGCGAYGLPLAARVKKMGKQAVHLGGALQLLFGIKGARWDTHPIISGFYNDSWVRPSDSERPANAGNVENGCYW